MPEPTEPRPRSSIITRPPEGRMTSELKVPVVIKPIEFYQGPRSESPFAPLPSPNVEPFGKTLGPTRRPVMGKPEPIINATLSPNAQQKKDNTKELEAVLPSERAREIQHIVSDWATEVPMSEDVLIARLKGIADYTEREYAARLLAGFMTTQESLIIKGRSPREVYALEEQRYQDLKLKIFKVKRQSV